MPWNLVQDVFLGILTQVNYCWLQPADMEEIVLDPKDDKLLEEDFAGANDLKRSQRHAMIISWMRRPDYISTEQTRYQPQSMEKVESKIGFVVRKKMQGEQVISIVDFTAGSSYPT